jgi:hypothetical protein
MSSAEFECPKEASGSGARTPKKAVTYDDKYDVVTLTGDFNSQSPRGNPEHIPLSVPNVKRVVNVLQVRNRKANSLK